MMLSAGSISTMLAIPMDSRERTLDLEMAKWRDESSRKLENWKTLSKDKREATDYYQLIGLHRSSGS